jgi:hypothetical protein
MTTSRTDFIESWLVEMPQRKNVGDMYPIISRNIKELIDNGIKPIKVTDNLYKIVLNTILYYWYGKANTIIIGVELSKTPQNLTVNFVGKNPEYSGKPPYAGDLYDAIIKDNHYSLGLTSDQQLSDEGFSIWKRLFNKGHTISVYDTTNPGQSRVTFKNEFEMNDYFGDDPSFKKYRFIVSESSPEKLGEIIGHFNTRRMRELAGIL